MGFSGAKVAGCLKGVCVCVWEQHVLAKGWYDGEGRAPSRRGSLSTSNGGAAPLVSKTIPLQQRTMRPSIPNG